MSTSLPNTDLVGVDSSVAGQLEARPDLRVSNLAELWWLRQRFFAEIDRVNGLAGSCLGLRWDKRTNGPIPDAPAVVVVVPPRPKKTWTTRMLSIGGVGRMLYAVETPFGRPLWCWVEVVPAKNEDELACDDRQPTDLGLENQRLLQRLRRFPLRPGSRIHAARGGNGALGPILRWGGERFAATARHVVGSRTVMNEPVFHGRERIGAVAWLGDEECAKDYLDGRLHRLRKGLPEASLRRRSRYVLDAAWIRLESQIPCVGWPEESRKDAVSPDPFELDPLRPGFEPLGERVLSCGPQRGAQAGQIVGFNLQQRDDNSGGSWFADYVIRPLGGPGENADEEQGPLFSEDGDSGKGIWLERGGLPIGILHDALNVEARIGRGPEFWSVASDLGRAWHRMRQTLPEGG